MQAEAAGNCHVVYQSVFEVAAQAGAAGARARNDFCFAQLKRVCTPPHSQQIIQYKGVTSILYENKDLAPKVPTSDWLGLMRSHTEAVTIVAHG